MVRIRFRRMGLKGQPSYRIVVTDQRSPRDGRFIEIIGFHNPRTQPATDTIKEDRALHWLTVGAQPSDAVKRVMQRTGTWGRFERLRKGEALETLVAEAQAQYAEVHVSPKTRYPSPGDGQSKWKAAERAAAAAAAAAEEAVADTAKDAVDAVEAGAKTTKAAAETAAEEVAETAGDAVDAIEADVKKVAKTAKGAVDEVEADAKKAAKTTKAAVETAEEEVAEKVEDAVDAAKKADDAE